MKLTQELRSSIQKSMLLKQETKHQLLNNWGRLDDRTKKNIVELLEEANEVEFNIFGEFIEKVRNGGELIKSKINSLKQKALRKIENEKENNADEKLDSKLDNI
ncbi:hypothetical protein [Candidatus Absconditicoccus praedator]|uniref:hypothetical protein n=1 Tax=Candidatus Absconditicoccus praedator TaxID=2735562 RepID=UPI001E3F9455|nr:hypothetical protein [Candidatus Absconditicoccus praedator]UFX83168.1 hypothetical protein HLG78_03475 [Candidatus Absconditicoccus praedator]